MPASFSWQNYVFRDVEDYAVYKPFMTSKTKTGKPIKTDVGRLQEMAHLADIGSQAALGGDQRWILRKTI